MIKFIFNRDQARRKPRPIFIRGNGGGVIGERSKQAISYNHDDHNRHWVVRLSVCPDKGRKARSREPARRGVEIAP